MQKTKKEKLLHNIIVTFRVNFTHFESLFNSVLC